MRIPNRIVRLCIATSLLCANAVPALADGCSDMRNQIAQVQSDATVAGDEQNRVARMTPLPRTDGALCAAEVTLITHSRALLNEQFTECFDAQQSATINDAISTIYQGANEVAGQMHCTL
jgi:hypothetical protein